ncbi:glycosyltransferase family 87 protein [Salinarimonas soli]|uniref:glycosyltransferase family 87 protein n=1 Tax=Salinarimonas soli TaxID=1638099 RepID=UPI001661C9BC|nr:glycosyltransferase family 87 protein [Salinarimonas soli]
MALPACAFVLLVLFGVIGLLRTEGAAFDVRVLYGAGAWYLEGISPYGIPKTAAKLHDIGLEMWVYAYPPHLSPFLMLLASLSFAWARAVMVVANVAACLALAFLVARFMQAEARQSGRPVEPWLPAVVAALIIGSPFTAHVVWLGNTSLLIGAALVGAWWFDRERRPVIAGILLALASIKPQFALLPGLWLLMERRWTTVFTAGLTVAALSALHVIQFGPIQSFRLWLEGLEVYDLVVDQLQPHATRGRMGVDVFLNSMHITDIVAIPLGLAILTVLWRYRTALSRLEILASLCAFAVLFLPSHNYDLVLLAPLAGALALRTRSDAQLAWVALTAGLLMMLPQRFVLLFAGEPLTFWRVPVLLFLQVLLIALTVRRYADAPIPFSRAKS